MATQSELISLVESHAEGDDSHFYSVAMQVAAKAARNGQSRFATELRDLVKAKRAENDSRKNLDNVIPLVQPKSELTDLLSVSYSDTKLSDLVFSDEKDAQLRQIIKENRQIAKLAKYGLQPVSNLLLVGSPGTGKTSTALAIAGELGVPMFTVRLDSLLTRFMGESASKLRLIFNALAETRGVYLFDEVDAIGSERSLGNDVGEIRRLLNSFLQFLEEGPTDSILIATTNHPQLLDKAIFRRFDAMLEYELPGPLEVERILKNRLVLFDTQSLNWKKIVASADGLSPSDICSAAESSAKLAILDGHETIASKELIHALLDRKNMHKGVDRT